MKFSLPLLAAVAEAAVVGRGSIPPPCDDDRYTISSDGIKAQVPVMIAGGGGVIVNIGSILSKVAFAGVGPYVAAKHGVDGLTKSLTLEYAASGIRALTIGPAFIRTGLEQQACERYIVRLGGPQQRRQAVAPRRFEIG